MLTPYEEYLVSLFEYSEEISVVDTETSAVSADDEPSNELPKAEDVAKKYGIKSPVMGIYSRGDRFEIHDNQDLYQIVKMVKDFTDKHFYAQNFKYLTEVSYRTLTIKIIQNPHKIGQGDIMDYHISSVIQYITSTINTLFPGKYDIDTMDKTLPSGLKETTVVVKQK